MDVRTEDLITKDDVGDALMRADEGDVIRDHALEDGSDFEEEALETIRSVTGRIQDWLARDLIAAEHTDYMSPRDWSQKRAHPTPSTAHPYRYYPRQWPLLAVTGKSEAEPSVHLGSGSKVVWSTASSLAYVTYIAGYKRPDQQHSDFPTVVTDNVDQGAIPRLPEKIRQVAENIVIYRIMQRLSALIGISMSEVSYGEFENTKSQREADKDYEERQLRTLTAGHGAIA
jgi:hypothetical protein